MIVAGQSDRRITAGSQHSCVQLVLIQVARSMALWQVLYALLGLGDEVHFPGAVVICMSGSPIGRSRLLIDVI